jgi:hypothetical protein
VSLLTPTAISCAPSSAELEARRNFDANVAALRRTQPALAETIQSVMFDQWVFARDGSLHAFDATTQRWFANCSVPLLAGRAVLATLEPGSMVSCFLAPAHAGLLRAARERAGDDAAILAIIPELTTLRVILSCHDFSGEIASHHLWFAAGAAWAAELGHIFAENPGLPTPARFIRTKLIDGDLADAMIRDAQQVFSDLLADRARAVESIRVGSSPSSADPNRLLVIAGSRFRLWDDAGEVLVEALTSYGLAGATIERFDIDDPATSSPLALATAAARCGRGVAAANVGRADAPNLVPIAMPWVTWVTRPLTPAFTAAGPRDALVVADPAWKATALSAGWPAERVDVAGWPSAKLPNTPAARPSLALIADTQQIAIPGQVEDLSSHRLLWENIEAEIHDDPLIVEDPYTYLDNRAERMNIAPEGLDRRTFIEKLVQPAYEQGIARMLLRQPCANISLRVFGRGWGELDEFKAIDGGSLLTRKALLAAVAAAGAVVYPWPVRHAHAMDSFGRVVVHRPHRSTEALLRRTAPTVARMEGPNSLCAAVLRHFDATHS